jgi:hypothetical protein
LGLEHLCIIPNFLKVIFFFINYYNIKKNVILKFVSIIPFIYFILFIYKLKKYYLINKSLEKHILKVYQKTKVNIQRYSIQFNIFVIICILLIMLIKINLKNVNLIDNNLI